MKRISCITIFILAVSCFISASVSAETGYYRYPDIYGNNIVFTAEDDLFIVSTEGGIARRLTHATGREAFAHFSPDGRWIAFSGYYDGNEDVYVVPAEGGEPKRLTYHPDSDQVVEWVPDGSGILFRSRRDSHFYDNSVYVISPEGGFPQRIKVGLCAMLSYHRDGKQVLFNRFSREFRHWKRYLGGWQQDIWYGNIPAGKFMQLTSYKGTDAFPMWWGDKAVFLSDRSGTANLYTMNIAGFRIEPVTSFTDFDVRWPCTDGERVVYMLGGDLWITSLSKGIHRKIPVELPSDRLRTRQRFENPRTYLTDYELAPDGNRILLCSRGEIFTAPLRDGRIINLTGTPGTREKFPSYSPDGNWIACFSDMFKEEELVLISANGKKETRQLTAGETHWHFPPRWSPDGNWIAFADKTQTLYVFNVKNKKKIEVDRSNVWEFTDYTFSPDSRWLAYAKFEEGEMRSVFLYNLKDKKITRVTGKETDDFNPVFDPKGRYLYFLSKRTFNPLLGNLDFQTIMLQMTKPYLVILKKGERSPLLPSPEEEIESLEELEWQKKFEKFSKEPKEKEEIVSEIDTEGISDRIVEFPVHAGFYQALAATEDNVYYLSSETQGLREEPPYPYEEKHNPFTLHYFNLKIEKQPKVFAWNIDGYGISRDGQKLVYRKDDEFYIVDSGSPAYHDNDKNKVDLSKWVLSVDPREEWKQIFYEAWRFQRDFYWAENMAGSDWIKLKEKYEVLIPRIATRDDLNDVIGEMIAELATSHTYIWGGDIERPKNIGVGLLGADLIQDSESGYWQIKTIYHGDRWKEDNSSPLLQSHNNVKEGDYIIAVDGIYTDEVSNIYSLFMYKANTYVQLTVNDQPSDRKSRDIVVRTLSGDRELRYRDWVEGNRMIVDRATNGKVGYIHLPNMGGRGLAEFNRQFYYQLDKQGLIVDVRNNGGGFVSQLILERLGRKLWAFDQPRHGKTFTYPYRVLHGHMVAICNQRCGSDGDIFSRIFKKRNLGPLVGMRTWGGVIGIRMDKLFIDKGMSSQPEFAWWEPVEGWNIENEGVIPDYEIDIFPQDMESGKDPQLDKALELILQKLADDPMEIQAPPPVPDKSKESFKQQSD